MSQPHPQVFVIFEAASGGYAWNLIDSEGCVLAASVQPLPSASECRRQIELVRGSWRAAIHEKAVTPDA